MSTLHNPLLRRAVVTVITRDYFSRVSVPTFLAETAFELRITHHREHGQDRDISDLPLRHSFLVRFIYRRSLRHAFNKCLFCINRFLYGDMWYLPLQLNLSIETFVQTNMRAFIDYTKREIKLLRVSLHSVLRCLRLDLIKQLWLMISRWIYASHKFIVNT